MSIYNHYLVCYDVADNKTRKRMFEFLKDLGLVALQKSIFWGQLTRAELSALKREAKKELDPDTDKMFWIITQLNADKLKEGLGYDKFVHVDADGNYTI